MDNLLILFGYFFAIELFLIVLLVVVAIIYLIFQRKSHIYNLSNFQTLLQHGDIKMSYKDTGKPIDVKDLAKTAQSVVNKDTSVSDVETKKERKWKNPYTEEEV